MEPLPIVKEIETRAVLRKVTLAHKALAELKGIMSSIPNENILLETLTLQGCRAGFCYTSDRHSACLMELKTIIISKS